MSKIKTAIINGKLVEPNRKLVGVSMDKNGYFADLLFKVMEELEESNQAKTFKISLLMAAKELGIIDKKEFDEAIKFRI
jgi:hypothetical protein